jgi:uncharacterized protein (DUF952 family)
MALILHLLAASEAARAVVADRDYVPSTFATDGFVHCTAGDAGLLEIANAFYRDRTEPMVAWTIDTDRLASVVRWEAPAPPDGSVPARPARPAAVSIRFPHVYGPIALQAVTATRVLRRDAEGAYVGYESPS